MSRSLVSSAWSLFMAASIATAAPTSMPLEDLPGRLQPKQPRSEEEMDRVEAASRFAMARIEFQRENFDKALRHYQRAYRYDPTAPSILAEIVPLAFQLNRKAEAARYATLSAESDPKDPALLRGIAMYLTETRDLARALKLYEKAIWLTREKKPDATTVLVRMETGRLYFLNRKYKESAESFAVVRDALESPEKYGLSAQMKKIVLGRANVTYSLMAEGFLEAKRPDDAADMYKKANEAVPNPAMLSFQLARVDESKGLHKQALEKLESYFAAKQPVSGSQPYELLATIIAGLEINEENARRELHKRLKLLYAEDENNAALGYFLANQFREAEMLDEAEELYSKMLTVRPVESGILGRIDVRHRAGNHEKLLDAIGEAVERPEVISLETVGEELQELGIDEDLVTALIALARKRQQSDPKSLSGGAALGVALLAIGTKQFELANEFFGLALEANAVPKPQLMLSWAREMFYADENAKAAEIFRRMIDEKVAPDSDSLFYFYLASALELDGRTDEAMEAAEKAAKGGDSPTFRSRQAWILYHAKRNDEAYQRYIKLIEDYDSDHKTPGARETLRDARSVLSNLCVMSKDFPQAEEWLEQVLDEFPEDIGALNDLGYLYADQGKRLNRSLRMVSKAVEAEPDNMAYQDSLGWAYYRMGRFPEAVKHLEKAADVAGEDLDGVVFDHLGDAYLKTDQRDKALEAWKKAVDAFTESESNEELKKTKAKLKQAMKE